MKSEKVAIIREEKNIKSRKNPKFLTVQVLIFLSSILRNSLKL